MFLNKIQPHRVTFRVTRLDRRGFTLVEVLISMVVLAVVLSAITTLNFSAITSYTSSRDSTEATFLGQKTMTAIVAEAEQWRGPSTTASGLRGIYTADTAFGNTSILASILAQPNLRWIELTRGVPVSSNGLANRRNSVGRFCVAGRHVDFPSTAPAGLRGARIQIAIFYPSPSKHGVDTCASLLLNGDIQSLSRGATPGEQILRDLGTRTEFFSLIVTPPAPTR